MRQLINVATADWDDTLIEIAGLSKNRLPECLPTGAPLGTLTEEAARQLGLPRSVKVYNGRARPILRLSWKRRGRLRRSAAVDRAPPG